MRKQPQPLSRSSALEILVGLVLMLGALAWWSRPVAIFAAGAILVAGSIHFRRPA